MGLAGPGEKLPYALGFPVPPEQLRLPGILRCRLPENSWGLPDGNRFLLFPEVWGAIQALPFPFYCSEDEIPE